MISSKSDGRVRRAIASEVVDLGIIPSPVKLGLPYVLLLEDMSSFLTKKNLSSEDAQKLPNVLHFGIMNSKIMSNHSPTKILESFSANNSLRRDDHFFGLHLFLGRKMDICGHDDFFFGLHLFLGRKMDICGHDDSQRTCPPFVY